MAIQEQLLNALESEAPMECLIGVVKMLLRQEYERQWIIDTWA